MNRFFDVHAYQYTRNTAKHHPDKKGAIACYDAVEPSVEKALQFAGEHARYHHAQRHKSRAESIMRGFVFSLTEMQQIGRIGGESVAIAQLLQTDASVNAGLVLYLGHRQEKINQIR